MTSRLLFGLVIAVLGFTQCSAQLSAALFGGPDSYSEVQNGYYRPYPPPRTTALQRCYYAVRRLVVGVILFIFKLPIILVRCFLWPIQLVLGILRFIIRIPLYPFRLLYRCFTGFFRIVRGLFG